jgi:hypothetical protein
MTYIDLERRSAQTHFSKAKERQMIAINPTNGLLRSAAWQQ